MEKLSEPKPLLLSGNKAVNWIKFRQRFENYLEATGAAEEKSDKAKTCILLHVIGEDALELYNNFVFADEADKYKLKPVVDRFEAYCLPKNNETFERYKFFTCDQRKDEKIDEYLNELLTKAKNCNFGGLKDSLIRDRLVCGILDDNLREKLLRIDDLTLDKTMSFCRAAETTKDRLKEMSEIEERGGTDAEEVYALKSYGSKFKRERYSRDKQKPKSQSQQYGSPKHYSNEYGGNKSHAKNGGYHQREKIDDSSPCGRCGTKHNPKPCPALGSTCNHCGRKDHYAKMCFYKKKQHKSVHTVKSKRQEYVVSSEEDENYEYCIDSIDSSNREEWRHSLSTNGSFIKYKLDTGSHVNVLSKKDFLKLKKKSKINKTSIQLTSYSGDKIETEGSSLIDIEYKGIVSRLMFIIAKNNVTPILGLAACEKLGLIKRVFTIENEAKPKTEYSHKYFEEYKDVFIGLGCLPGEHTIEIDESIKPVVHACRKVPFPLHDRVKQELDRMVELNVICREENPTEWVNSLVVVPKANKDQLRLCLDPRDLNQAIKREHYKLPTREEIMAQFSKAKYFSKLDASSGFWQMKLSDKSSKLTCFNTPFGRYRFLRLPFGISSAPEVYHKAIYMIFEHIDGAVTMMDDLVVWGRTKEEHDQRLKQVLDTVRKVNLKLNKSKCIFGVNELTFIGDVISADGLKPDPLKVQAIQEFEQPTCKKDVQRLIGMVNYLARYLPDLSTVTTPLRQLLDKNIEFEWTKSQEDSFNKIKDLLSTQPVLKFYDPDRPILISADASKSGLGAVLLQKYENQWCPVAYASRAMLSAETRYAQIEKETLALTFACERFHQYLYGQNFQAETDHKPLVSIFQKPLNDCPIRIQRFLLRLQKYSLKLVFTPGKDMFISDCLSRAYVTKPNKDDISGETKIDVYVDMIVSNLAYTDERLENIRSETQKDEQFQLLIQQITDGFAENKKDYPKELTEFWNIRHELTYLKGLIFKGERIVIPTSLRKLMLSKIHTGHLGIEKCCRRARDTMYWPRMNQCIKELINSCPTCLKYRPKQASEPLHPHPLTKYPWEKIGVDLCVYNNRNFLVMCDYFSNYPEVIPLNTTTSEAVIKAMKRVFSNHGIPREVFSDNGPQFSSRQYRDFAKSFDFKITTSSPHFPQSNGLVEKTVGVVKNLLKKSDEDRSDFYMGLLIYRSTPLEHGQSPAEILYGRRLRSNLPVQEKLLYPKPAKNFKKKREEEKRKQKVHYDKRVRKLPKLIQGDSVRMRDYVNNVWSKKAIVQREIAPRSFIVITSDRVKYRRNRKDLLKCEFRKPLEFRDNVNDDDLDLFNELDDPNPINNHVERENMNVQPRNLNAPRRSRYGRNIRAPRRLIEEV